MACIARTHAHAMTRQRRVMVTPSQHPPKTPDPTQHKNKHTNTHTKTQHAHAQDTYRYRPRPRPPDIPPLRHPPIPSVRPRSSRRHGALDDLRGVPPLPDPLLPPLPPPRLDGDLNEAFSSCDNPSPLSSPAAAAAASDVALVWSSSSSSMLTLTLLLPSSVGSSCLQVGHVLRSATQGRMLERFCLVGCLVASRGQRCAGRQVGGGPKWVVWVGECWCWCCWCCCRCWRRGEG